MRNINKPQNQLRIYYDEEGDLLEIRMGNPTPAYYEEIKDGVFERIDEKTGKIRGFAIFSFRKRMEKRDTINVPLPVKVELTPLRVMNIND